MKINRQSNHYPQANLRQRIAPLLLLSLMVFTAKISALSQTMGRRCREHRSRHPQHGED
jgi:hypothetical protein